MDYHPIQPMSLLIDKQQRVFATRVCPTNQRHGITRIDHALFAPLVEQKVCFVVDDFFVNTIVRYVRNALIVETIPLSVVRVLTGRRIMTGLECVTLVIANGVQIVTIVRCQWLPTSGPGSSTACCEHGMCCLRGIAATTHDFTPRAPVVGGGIGETLLTFQRSL
uniref:Uncharacterized protein n=1 Tax=Anopheles farauti TaxID=69004 RepID=A0A182R085_9DIPT